MYYYTNKEYTTTPILNIYNTYKNLTLNNGFKSGFNTSCAG